MTSQMTTYSGKAANLTFTHPYIGSLSVSGISGKGLVEVNVRPLQDQSDLQIGMDGSVAPSVIPGDHGEIEVKVWQSSTTHADLLEWYNQLKSYRDAGDVSEWFSGVINVQNTATGRYHYATGVAPKKVPDETSQKQAQPVSWVFVACDVTHG